MGFAAKQSALPENSRRAGAKNSVLGTTMPGNIEGGRDSRLEIAHVLFIDIVDYSKLLSNEQRERQQELNRIVRKTEQFRAAEAEDKLVRIPTGDGMVLAFFTSPDAPVRCAVAISHALRGTSRVP